MRKFTMGNFGSRPVFQVLLACVALLNPVLGLAQSGTLDNSFANHGIFTTNFSACCGAAQALAIQTDGKILVAGQLRPSLLSPLLGGIIRLNTDGTVDHAFGSAGMVTISLGSIGASINGVAIQTDGKILASISGVFVGAGEVARFNPNGSLDPSFGTNGIVRASLLIPSGPLLVQPDGKILVLSRVFLTRLDPNGQLDATFGTAGMAVLLEAGSSLALLSNGQILISSGAVGAGPGPSIATFLGVTRYNANGSVDKTFGILGRGASFNSPASLVIDSSGAIVAAGRAETGVAIPTVFTGNPSGFAVTRFTANGVVDPAFAVHGGTTTTFPQTNFGSIAAIALQTDGDIVAVGQAGRSGNNQLSSTFALARYLPTGQLDNTFGTSGRVTTSFGSNNEAFASAVAIQTDGKIVVAGNTGDASGNFAVARYLP